jgi:predicted esterase YcpF (UPF0227 family)
MHFYIHFIHRRARKFCVLIALATGFTNYLLATTQTPSIYAKFSPEKLASVKNKYEHTMLGKQFVFYPAQTPKRLVITLSGMGDRVGKYMMWTWFWQDHEDWHDTAYLFLKDDDKCWYLGNDKTSFIESYSNIITHHIAQCNLTPSQTFTIGSSMGGYAAIFYATILKLHAAIAVNPQVSNETSSNLTRFDIDRTGSQWQDLDKLIANSKHTPLISLIFSRYRRDELAGFALLNVLKNKNATFVTRRHPSDHHSFSGLSKAFIDHEINFLANQVPLIATAQKK